MSNKRRSESAVDGEVPEHEWIIGERAIPVTPQLQTLCLKCRGEMSTATATLKRSHRLIEVR